MDETIREFLVEAQENMERAYKSLEALEVNPQDLEAVRNLFRCIHSIKGAAGFFNFTSLEGVGHFCEDMLSKLRDGKFQLNPERQALLYEAADAIDKILASLVQTGSEGGEDFIELIMRLRDETQKEGNPGAVPSPVAKPRAPQKDEGESAHSAESVPQEAGDIQAEPPDAEEDMEPDTEEEHQEVAGQLAQPVPAPVHDDQPLSPSDAPAKPASGGKPGAGDSSASSSSPTAESTIRVDVSLLERLMNLVEELVLSRNQIIRHTNGTDNTDLLNASQVLNLVTGQLQEGIMKTRMQPISTVFNKFPRIVREVARSCEKEIAFRVEGEETELDRTIIEAIKDPLTHIVRNSIDHGIEKPAERAAAGKPETGTLLIRAFHEGGQVVIEIVDDGAGINTDRVRAKAIERGIIAKAQADEMTTSEINNLIFLPGFSTAQSVSNLSGRGVGMDVVKTNIEKIGGVVDLNSESGRGTTLRISIPLTLAIIPALIVSVHGERFAIPQVNLQELVRVEGEDVDSQIERVAGAETYRLRGNLLPLLRLAEVLRLDDVHEADSAKNTQDGGPASKKLNILVLVSGNVRYGLVVDQVYDIEEVVVKSISKYLGSVRAYAGATILGDGKVVLILDTIGLAGEADIKFDSADGPKGDGDHQLAKKAVQEMQNLLLFSVAPTDQFAIPLALVSRLERFRSSELTFAGGKEVIQYRGRVLPTLRLEKQIPIGPPPEQEGEINVIVFNFDGKEVGVLVTKIVDVLETVVELDHSTFDQTGILGSGIIGGLPTLFLDVFSIVGSAFPKWFENKKAPMGDAADFGAAPEKMTILLAEDSQFFRTVIRSYLESMGFNVIETTDGNQALRALDSGVAVDMVVTDIEMPTMNGFELTERIRASERWSGLPIMALTSLASEEDRERALKAGVDEYCVKLDRMEVLEKIRALVRKRLSAGAAA